jgi:hypothetical protein
MTRNILQNTRALMAVLAVCVVAIIILIVVAATKGGGELIRNRFSGSADTCPLILVWNSVFMV